MEKFSYEANGYNRREVNQFVGTVIVETEAIIDRVKQQEKTIDALHNEIERHKEFENNLRGALRELERRKEGTFSEEAILSNAKEDASVILQDALDRAGEIERQRVRIEKNMEVFKKKLRLLVEEQLEIADNVEKIELVDE